MPPKGWKDPSKWVTQTCLNCGKTFEARKIYVDRGQMKNCSVSCGYYSRLNDPDDILGNQPRPGCKRTYARPWTIRKDGYIVFTRGKYNGQRVHRIIAERALGRKLKRSEVVHHVDGNKLNNRRGNLLICTQSYHRYLHAKMERLEVGQCLS